MSECKRCSAAAVLPVHLFLALSLFRIPAPTEVGLWAREGSAVISVQNWHRIPANDSRLGAT